MKKCELCKLAAKTYCESDQASLCWDCDSKVHAANFLVARHCRTLLCNICQSLTPWRGHGAKLGQTVSVCVSCTDFRRQRKKDESESKGGNDYDDVSNCEEVEEEEEKDGGDNQVVPGATKSLPPPASSSSSSSGDSSNSDVKNREGVSSLKRRKRDKVDLGFYLSDRKFIKTDNEVAAVNSFRQQIWSEDSGSIDLNLPPSSMP
ncbi:hypothetical protein ACFE04_017355 [Oxalis oulophora]